MVEPLQVNVAEPVRPAVVLFTVAVPVFAVEAEVPEHVRPPTVQLRDWEEQFVAVQVAPAPCV